MLLAQAQRRILGRGRASGTYLLRAPSPTGRARLAGGADGESGKQPAAMPTATAVSSPPAAARHEQKRKERETIRLSEFLPARTGLILGWAWWALGLVLGLTGGPG